MRNSRAVRQAYFHHYFIRRFSRARHAREALRPGVQIRSSMRPVPRKYRDRGLARFYFNQYRGARDDFDVVLSSEPTNARALYGRTMSSICLNEWERAGEDIRRLIAADELNVGDRLVTGELFQTPAALESLFDGLRSYRRYNPMDGDARVVSVWLHWITGRTGRAQDVYDFAISKAPSNKTLKALGALLRAEKQAAKAKAAPVPSNKVPKTVPTPTSPTPVEPNSNETERLPLRVAPVAEAQVKAS